METVQSSTQNKKKYRASPGLSHLGPGMPSHQNAGASLPSSCTGVHPEDPRCAKWWWTAQISTQPPDPPCHRRVSASRQNAECLTLFLGLNLLRLELNQVGRKFRGPRARAVVFLSKFNYNSKVEPRGLGMSLGWPRVVVQYVGRAGLYS